MVAMSGTRKDGGAAFPTEPNTQHGFFSHHGMSMRDAAALAVFSVFLEDGMGPKTAAAAAFQAADAFLAERERQP